MRYQRLRFVLVGLVLVLALAGCQFAPLPPAVPAAATPTESLTEEATPTSLEAATPEVEVTAEMTPDVTATVEVTATPEVALTPTVTATAAMTASALSVPFEAIQMILDFAPGAWTPPHSHGGPVLVTVLEGEMTVRQEETGEETVYAAGDFWIEQLDEAHAAGNARDENARVAVIFLLPEGGELTTVAEGTASGELPPGPTPVYRTSMPVTTAESQ